MFVLLLLGPDTWCRTYICTLVTSIPQSTVCLAACSSDLFGTELKE